MTDHTITASWDVLLNQAGSTAETHLWSAHAALEKMFGESFADENPALVVEMAKLVSEDFRSTCIVVASQQLSEALMWMKRDDHS